MTPKEQAQILKAFKVQNHHTSVVSIIDPTDPFKPAFSGRVLSIATDEHGLPETLVVRLSDEFLMDDFDDGLRRVPITDIYQAHYVSLN